MSIRNATIVRRQRQIGLFEHERVASIDRASARRRSIADKGRKKATPLPRKAAWAGWQEH